ncbi:hypothetical protein Psi02_57000 [Planotetraspora silvatica]|uniref:Uncharacterized protein n=1 Tax=Planotetraspora silvatica TaxID=234614 RepID=A0A8J3UTM9_9ACTN|nr:hypothetical protein [Planotetraspora silvatica]GII49276.1 hypothetical protein Psi02_57000 [Planotetraspora silvatica]
MPIDLAGAVAGYLVQVLGKAGIALVRGPADERALRKAIHQAIEAVVARADEQSRETLRRGLRQCFSASLQIPIDASLPVGDAVRMAIAGQAGQLAQWVNTRTGRPFYQDITMSPH